MIEQAPGKLALGFRLIAVGEITAYLIWLISGLAEGQKPIALVLMIAAVMVGIRAVITASNFLQTWLARSPREPDHRITWIASVLLFARETWAALLTYPGYFALEGQLVPNAPASERGGRGPPIVLVPGFACNRGYFGRMRRRLQQANFGPVYAVTLEPVFGDIESNARLLGDFVDEVRQRTGAQRLVLIGHSMGGLTIRSYLHQLDGASKVAGVISLGTPYQGTVIARGFRGLGRCLQQMTPGNPWLVELNRCETEAAPVPLAAIWSPHDSIVAPQAGSAVPEIYGRSIALPGIGHVEMIISSQVIDTVINIVASMGTRHT